MGGVQVKFLDDDPFFQKRKEGYTQSQPFGMQEFRNAVTSGDGDPGEGEGGSVAEGKVTGPIGYFSVKNRTQFGKHLVFIGVQSEKLFQIESRASEEDHDRKKDVKDSLAGKEPHD